jgi:Ca2+-binding RTX toxin-like protein
MANVYGHDYAETLDAADGVTNGADTIFGFGGNDSIFGLGGNDEIKGGGGADTINGGSGTDTANYSDSSVGVVVSLLSGSGSGGTAQGDSLVSIENLTGSAHDDLLIGNDGNNVLTGLEDADTLKGGGGADTLYGDSGNDRLKGGGGADTLNGGSGVDTADYYGSSSAVVISLYTDYADGGDATGDELNSIENLNGSSHDDILWGNDGVNVIKGMDGNDSLKGYGGSDTLWGGEGADYLGGNDGDDTLRGENGADTLEGHDGHDLLFGGAGADILTGGIGFQDIMNGEAGADTFKFNSAAECGLTAASSDQLSDFSEASGDRIDLSTMDANTNTGGNDAFTFIGNDNAFTGVAGQLRYNTSGYVEGDLNGDAVADFYIAVNNALTPVMHDYGFVL